MIKDYNQAWSHKCSGIWLEMYFEKFRSGTIDYFDSFDEKFVLTQESSCFVQTFNIWGAKLNKYIEFRLSPAVLVCSQRWINMKWSVYLIMELMCATADRMLVPVYVSWKHTQISILTLSCLSSWISPFFDLHDNVDINKCGKQERSHLNVEFYCLEPLTEKV